MKSYLRFPDVLFEVCCRTLSKWPERGNQLPDLTAISDTKAEFAETVHGRDRKTSVECQGQTNTKHVSLRCD